MNAFALIVEDDPSLADIFSTTLQEAHYATEIACDGSAALARLKEVIPDLILLDLHLPGLSGEALLEHIRGDARFEDTWVALVTADALLADYLRRKSGRMQITLLKPISPNQLLELAERLRKTIG